MYGGMKRSLQARTCGPEEARRLGVEVCVEVWRRKEKWVREPDRSIYTAHQQDL